MKRARTLRQLLFLSAIALFGRCALAQTPAVSVTDAWVRAIPGSDVASVYLTLRNAGTTPVTVVGAESSVASTAMIHESTIEGGVSKMRPQGVLIVAPGRTLKFEPGGLHVMLHGLKRPLTPGDVVPLVLLFRGGTSLPVQAQVRPLTAP